MSDAFRGLSTDLELRSLGRADVDWMLGIERAGYRYPWSQTQFLDCLGPGYEAWGAVLGGQLLGYLIHWQVVDEAHLMNLCVDPRYARRGVGRGLLRYWVGRMANESFNELNLEVRVSNRAARALYESEGFRAGGERPDYYTAGQKREAACIMKLRL